MSYDDIEASPYSGNKVELYLFEMPGSPTYWAYTTDSQPSTIDGKTYVPKTIGRTEQDQQTGKFEIELPYDDPVAMVHVPYLPARPMIVTVSAYHRQTPSDIRRTALGAIYNFDQKAEIATLHCADPGNPLEKLIPRQTSGPNCRHVTYGTACSLDEADWMTVIDDIADISDFVITSPKIGLAGTNWFKYGRAVNPATGEVRFITNHVGNDVTLVYPFIDIDESTVLHFYAGDDFKPETCRVKFNNKINYLGFDFHPKYNVFLVGYRAGGYPNTVGTGPGSGRIRPT